jgi:DNA-binding CsgD family transcriptional regulator
MQASTTARTSAPALQNPVGNSSASGTFNGGVVSLGHSLLPALLDELDFGLIVCDIDGAVLLANWAARQELSSGRWITARNGALNQWAFPHLGSAISSAVLRGRRQLVPVVEGETQMFVSVSPVAASGGTGDANHALLVFSRPVVCSRIGLELLAARFKLTESERRVLTGLVAHRTPAQVAHDHGVAISTVRTQINSLRSKLGVSGQRALFNLVATLPALATALRGMVEPVQPVHVRAPARGA